MWWSDTTQETPPPDAWHKDWVGVRQGSPAINGSSELEIPLVRAWKFGDVIVTRRNGVDVPCVVLATDSCGRSDPNYVVECVSPELHTMVWSSGEGTAKFVLDSRYDGHNFLDTLSGALADAIKKTLKLPADKQLQAFLDLFKSPTHRLHGPFKAALLAFLAHPSGL
jgi:hypothetical protein